MIIKESPAGACGQSQGDGDDQGRKLSGLNVRKLLQQINVVAWRRLDTLLFKASVTNLAIIEEERGREEEILQ